MNFAEEHEKEIEGVRRVRMATSPWGHGRARIEYEVSGSRAARSSRVPDWELPSGRTTLGHEPVEMIGNGPAHPLALQTRSLTGKHNS
jgi:hypothetical protein